MIGARKAEPTISMGRDDLCLSNSAIQFAETYATNALADARLASSVRMVGIGGTRHMMNAISQPNIRTTTQERTVPQVSEANSPNASTRMGQTG
jgi:hypothetical protein